MLLIKPGYKIEWGDSSKALKQIELAARNCYQTGDSIGEGTAEKLIEGTLLRLGHHAMIEFADICVRFITDRGVTHELVRHRLPSFAQESTRYCNYSRGRFGNQVKFIFPGDWELTEEDIKFLALIEEYYLKKIEQGFKPQQARYFLPNGLKTEILVKTNVREWRHIFTMRAINPAAHPQIRQITIPVLLELNLKVPILFEDLIPEDGFKNKDGSPFDMSTLAKPIVKTS